MKTVIQISDTHLRAGDSVSGPGWTAARAIIRDRAPALVIHTGDIVRDDPYDEADHRYAEGALAGLGVEVLAVPGNHDIGDGPPNADGPDRRLLASFRRSYGPDCWTRAIGDWLLIGVNGMTLGADEDDGPWDWLARALAAGRDASIALFTHKPPFLASPDEPVETSAVMPSGTRRRFWSLVTRNKVRLLACGHRHEYRVLARDGVLVVWAPTTSDLLDETSPPLAPVAAPGLVEYAFDGPTLHHRFVPFAGWTAR